MRDTMRRDRVRAPRLPLLAAFALIACSLAVARTRYLQPAGLLQRERTHASAKKWEPSLGFYVKRSKDAGARRGESLSYIYMSRVIRGNIYMRPRDSG